MLRCPQESNDGVLELQEDDPLAVEQMLRYVYTSQYTYEPMMRDATTWETHFNVMIVADKYGLPNLEELAYKKCEEHITRLQMTDKMLFRLVERSWEYGDRQSRFSKLIASLSAVSGSRFPELFNNSQFRPWIDAHPVVISPLIGKHFATLMRYQSFRNKISNDPAMALEHLDRLSSRVSSCYECKRAGF